MSRVLLASLALLVPALSWGEPFKPYRKVLVDRASRDRARLAGEGRLVAGYGSFELYEVGSDRIGGLEPRDDLDRLELKSGSFDTQLEAELPGIPEPLRERAEPAGGRLMLVQFVGPVQDLWLDALRSAGATPVHAVPADGMLVWASKPAAAELRRLAAERGFLQYAGPYHPYYKLAPRLAARLRDPKPSAEVLTVTVQRYAAAGRAGGPDRVSALAEAVLVPWWPILSYENQRLRLRAERIAEVLHEPAVVWVGEWQAPRLFDEVQDQILAGRLDSSGTGPAGPGYLAWLLGHGLSPNPAAYPVVAITDDGIGNGTVNTGDPTLHEQGDPARPTRVAFNADCTGDGAHGPDGHGHLNTSIAGGYDARAGSPFQDEAGFARGLGVNPFGRVAGVRIFNDAGSFDASACGNTDSGIILRSFRSGARISSNSWGALVQGDYEDSAQAYDAATRDARPQQNGSQQMLFVFAAGNEGPGSSTIGTPATAKNVVSVGASENVRPDGVDRCLVGPDDADDLTEIIDFSSRGSAEGGRVKPDVVAPGTHVQGTASTERPYTGNAVCDRYWPAGQTIFARSSGTSHSTPAVAGVLSLYRHWIANRLGVGNPSPALLKAYLLAHTRYLTGQGAGDDLPSNSQGYGLPDLSLGFDEARRVLVNQSQRLNASGEAWTTQVGVEDPGRAFKVVLAWTDAPGSLAGAPQVNDLDLVVTVGGTQYLGNRFSGAWSVSGGSADRANNVEGVSLPPGTSGIADIQVTARNIAGDGVPGVGDATDQDFALVVYNGSDAPSFRLGLQQSGVGVCRPGLVSVPVSLDPIRGYNLPVDLSLEGLPAGATAGFAPPSASPLAVSSLTLGADDLVPLGSYPLQIVGTSGAIVQRTELRFSVEGALYGPFLDLPANGAGSVNPTPTLSWAAIAGAARYRVQVASEPGFSAPLVDQLVTGTSFTTPLTPGTEYFWRVHAGNSCGDGPFSDVRRFTTATISTISVSCTGLPLAMPDNDPAGVSCTLEAPADFVAVDVTFDVRIVHTWRGDLLLELTSPLGTKVRLKRQDIQDGTPDVEGNYDQMLTPSGPGSMSDFDGQKAGGTWRFFVSDNYAEDIGQIEIATLNLTGFVEQVTPVPLVGWLGGALAAGLAGWLCQRSARRRLG